MARPENTFEALSKPVLGNTGRCAAAISIVALGIAVSTMAVAQQGGRFKAAPEAAAPQEAVDAGTADLIFGIPANTLFFIAVGAIAVFWFTLGGGRKAKISRN